MPQINEGYNTQIVQFSSSLNEVFFNNLKSLSFITGYHGILESCRYFSKVCPFFPLAIKAFDFLTSKLFLSTR